MNKLLISMGKALMIAGLLALALLFTRTLASAGAGVEAPAGSAYEFVKIVPAAHFRADGYLPTSTFFNFAEGYLQGTADGYGCVVAPVHLTRGVEITRIRADVVDNDDLSNIQVLMWKLNILTGARSMIGVAVTDNADPAIQHIDAFLTDEIVAYPYTYDVTVCLLSSDIRLYGIAVYHQSPAFLPLIKNQ